jgi:hypothetical protein
MLSIKYFDSILTSLDNIEGSEKCNIKVTCGLGDYQIYKNYQFFDGSIFDNQFLAVKKFLQFLEKNNPKIFDIKIVSRTAIDSSNVFLFDYKIDLSKDAI